MLSQSAEEKTPTKEYEDAWATAQYLIYHDGGSLSGREWNRSYLNVGGGRFAEVSAVAGLDFVGDGRTVVDVDWDEDGSPDMFLKNRTGPRLQFLHNQVADPGHWLTLSLRGVTTHPDAIGARVEVAVGDRTLVRTLRAGSGFLGQSTKRLHFGLDAATVADRLTVLWPDGSRDEYSDLVADGHYLLRQGAPEAQLLPRRSTARLGDLPPAPYEARTGRARRVVLMEKLPLAELTVPSFEDPTRKVADLAGRPTLLNLWGTDCAACLKELKAFSGARARLDEAALTVVTLLTDTDQRERADELLERFGFREGAGPATKEFLDAFQLYLASIVGEVGSHQEVPLPTSLLLDPRGQLVAIYLGPVEVEDLLEDLAKLRTMDAFNPAENFLVDGIRLSAHRRNWRALSKSFERAGRADLAKYYLDLHRARPKRKR